MVLKITNALKKKSMKAMKRNEDNERSEFIVEHFDGDSICISNSSGVLPTSIKELERWVLSSRAAVGDSQRRHCTFVYKGLELNPEKSVMDYGIKHLDELQFIIN